MKNYKILLLATLSLSLNAFSQEDEEPVDLYEINNKKHEIRIDAFEGLAFETIDISYEFVINRYSGVGASISFAVGSPDVDFPQDFSFSPFYRQYFFNKKDYGARGFYAEGLLQIASGEGRIFDFDDAIPDQDWTQFGIGVTLGKKWVSRNGFVIDIHGGGGRYFGSDENSPDGFARIGVNLGYRF